MLITNFDVDSNFWELYPDMKIALSFKEIYKSDKSRNKESSSKMMWFVALTTDLNSKFNNIPIEERYDVISTDYMEDEKYYPKNKKKLDLLIKDYEHLMDTPVERHLRQWETSLDDRTIFLSTVKYGLDTYEDLDKMAVNTAKVFQTFAKIKEDLAKEKAGGGDVKGGSRESLADSGEI